MDFSKALELLKEGKRLCREGWNGKNMFVYLVKGTQLEDRNDLRNEADKHIPNLETGVTINGHLDMFTAQETIIVGWSPTQTDLLAEDWKVAE